MSAFAQECALARTWSYVANIAECFTVFKLFCFFNVDNDGFFRKIAGMIIDTEIKAIYDNIGRRAGYLWRFL